MTTPAEVLATVIPPRYGADDPATLMADMVDAAGGMLDVPFDTLADADDGTLTTAADTPDAWLRWLATCLGVPQRDSLTETRRLTDNRASVATAGSAPAIADLVRSYLTGSKSAIAMPTDGKPWTITIGVRADEAPDGLPALTGKILATGQVPAGFTVQVKALNATWADYEAAFPIWSDLHGVTWGERDSVGILQ